jgi:LmbE family N-acetylglucosaminyl deacetylase/SAM-dependent methyltransferase
MSAAAFDHRDDGTPEAQWRGLVARLPGVPAPGCGDHLVVLAAHPDDETLGAGGLIATASAAGARVTVVVATDGEASHPRSPTHAPERLAAIRRREVRAAVAALAPEADVRMLGLPDGRLGEEATGLARALTAAVGTCSHLVTPWCGDGHPDHAACGRTGAQLSARFGAHHWQYPIWAWHWGRPDGDLPRDRLFGVRLDPTARAAKLAALRCHVSQHEPLSPEAGDEPVLGPGMLAHFRRDVEAFVVDAPREEVSRAYFDELYARERDPWGLDRRFYERRKRAVLLSALVRARFRRAFEPGCATGLLTAELAGRCDEVIAWDLADAAVDRSRARLHGAANVTVSQGAIPDQWPDGTFDLVVLSEVGYYCHDLGALTARVDRTLDEDGVLVACHWRRAAPMHPQTAGGVHAALGAGRRLVVDHIEEDFLLQVWTRSGTSVAAADGIVR